MKVKKEKKNNSILFTGTQWTLLYEENTMKNEKWIWIVSWWFLCMKQMAAFISYICDFEYSDSITEKNVKLLVSYGTDP